MDRVCQFVLDISRRVPVPVAERSKAWVYGRWNVGGVAGSNPAVGHGCLSLVNVLCCQVEVSASG